MTPAWVAPVRLALPVAVCCEGVCCEGVPDTGTSPSISCKGDGCEGLKPARCIPRWASGFFMNVSHTNEVRAFSIITRVIPVSIPDHVDVVPVLQRIERVHEPVTAPRICVTVLDGAQHPHARLRQKRQRAGRRAGNYGAVHRTRFRRSAPHCVTVHRIRGGDAPQIVAVVGEFFREVQAKPAMNIGGQNRILEVVGVLVALGAEVKPGLRVLVHEKRRVGADDNGCRHIQTWCASRHPTPPAATDAKTIRFPAGTSSSFRCNRPSGIAGSRSPASSHAAISWYLPKASSNPRG